MDFRKAKSTKILIECLQTNGPVNAHLISLPTKVFLHKVRILCIDFVDRQKIL